MNRLAPLLFWIAALTAFVLANVPHPPHLPGEPTDKTQHIMAFAVLALLARIAWPRTASLKLFAMLSAFGALIEVVQGLSPFHRDAEVLDWVADTAACAAILAAALLWRRWADRG